MLNDMTDKSEYTGECPITSIIWAVPEGGSTWGTMRAALAFWNVEFLGAAPFSENNIRSCAQDLLVGNYPVFSMGPQLNVYVSSLTDEWDEFIRSWAAVYAHFGDVLHADDADEMAQILEDNPNIEAVEGETVDEFNTRMWDREVEYVFDALTEDFDALREQLDIAKTAYYTRYGVAA